ncbi:MAG: ABC transporter permease [Defluviitaleaceae bacterium]|nr:ABC transporter permease [Defluviitaleaceae bacterium]
MAKTWTRKHYMGATLLLSVVLSIVFFIYMPIEVADHRPGNVPLLVINSVFLAVTASAMVIGFVIILTKPDYVKTQILTMGRFRHLLLLMIKRDFVTRYRRSVLGVLWSVLNPLLNMLIITMVFSHIFRFDIENFPVYYLSGSMIYGFFSESTTLAMGSITGGAGTIKKVYVPKYIFPVARVLSSLVNLGFSFVAFLGVLFITGAPVNWTMFLIPIPIVYLIIFCMGVGMILSAVAVFFRDMNYIYGVGTTLLMFLTPIFYPVDILTPRMYHLIHLNPMFHYVTYFRDLALNGVVPNLWANIICIGFALAALSMGIYVKLSQQDKYILYL